MKNRPEKHYFAFSPESALIRGKFRSYRGEAGSRAEPRAAGTRPGNHDPPRPAVWSAATEVLCRHIAVRLARVPNRVLQVHDPATMIHAARRFGAQRQF